MLQKAVVSRVFDRFLGVALGGGKGKKTAVACLKGSGEGVKVLAVGTSNEDKSPFYDRALVSYLAARAKGAVLAVDAPLTMTACVRCQEPVCPGISDCVDPTVIWFRTVGEELIASARPKHDDAIASVRKNGAAKKNGHKPAITPYTQRTTEVYLHRRHQIVPRETLGQGMGPLASRAAHLVRVLAGHGFVQHKNMIEVCPKATLQQLFGRRVAQRYKREVGTWETRASVLEALKEVLTFSSSSKMAREQCLQNGHCFDAVICAYTASLWARDGWTLPNEHRSVFLADGWIYAPGLAGT